jgi:hypothetical protein
VAEQNMIEAPRSLRPGKSSETSCWQVQVEVCTSKRARNDGYGEPATACGSTAACIADCSLSLRVRSLNQTHFLVSGKSRQSREKVEAKVEGGARVQLR